MRRFTTTLVAIVAFSFASTVGAWEAVYSKAETDEFGDRVSVIYKMTDEGQEVRLTERTSDNNPFAWSRDGTEIAFSSDRNGAYDSFIMNADGSNQRLMGIFGSPRAVSANYVVSNRIVGPRPTVFLETRDGSRPRVELGFGEGGDISFDESRVVFSGGDVTIANTDGSNLQELVRGVYPSFLNDTTLVYQRDDPFSNVYTYDLETGEERLIAPGVYPSATDGWVVYSNAGWFGYNPTTSEEKLLLPYNPPQDRSRSVVRFFGNVGEESPRAVQPDTPGLRLTTLGWLKSQ